MNPERLSRRRFLQCVGATALSAATPSPEALAGTGKMPDLAGLAFSTDGYDKISRVEVPRSHFKDADGIYGIKPIVSLHREDLRLRGLDLRGTVGRFGIDGPKDAPHDVRIAEMRAGKIERGLRFKPITDAVERRYNLPPGILLAMLIQESSGMDLLPNGQDDGGVGLIHMQPRIAAEFGLRTYESNTAMVDKAYGARLRQLIADKKSDVFALAHEDDRFNRLLNIDAAGRMLAYHVSGPTIEGHGPLRTAIMRYAGKYNYEIYYKALRTYMRLLYSETYCAELAKAFNARNANLTINDKKPVGRSPFQAYLRAFWDCDERGLDLSAYRKLAAYQPTHSDTVLATYKKFFLEHEPNEHELHDKEDVPLPPHRPEL